MKRVITLLIIHLIVVAAWGQQDNRKELRQGNKLYDADKPVEAETAYRKALEVDKTSDKATFNLGDALYKQKKYDEAGKQFEAAASEMSDKKDKARAYHNLGNSLLQQQKIKESIDAYKQALRNNPNDIETKYNLSYAMNLLKQQQQQQNQNQDQQNQDKDKQDKDQDKQDQDQKENQDQQKQDQDQNQQPQQDQQRQDQTQKQKSEQQISREDAQRMLDAIAQEEKELQEKLQKKERAGYRSKIEKNW